MIYETYRVSFQVEIIQIQRNLADYVQWIAHGIAYAKYQHENLLRYYDSYFPKNESDLWIVIEYTRFNLVDLLDYASSSSGKLSESVISWICFQVWSFILLILSVS